MPILTDQAVDALPSSIEPPLSHDDLAPFVRLVLVYNLEPLDADEYGGDAVLQPIDVSLLGRFTPEYTGYQKARFWSDTVDEYSELYSRTIVVKPKPYPNPIKPPVPPKVNEQPQPARL